MNEGWLKLHRKILDSPIFTSEKGLKVWIWCLLKASHTNKEVFIGFEKVQIKPGDFVFGRDSASSDLGMKPSTVRNWMEALKKDSKVDIKTTTKYSIVSIKNWNTYQEKDNQVDNKVKTNGQQMDTNKNVKNVKNISTKVDMEFGNSLVNHVLKEFEKTYSFQPTDPSKFIRREAWSLVTQLKTILREGNKDTENSDLVERFITYYFNWIKKQDGFDKIQRLQTVRGKISIFKNYIKDKREKRTIIEG